MHLENRIENLTKRNREFIARCAGLKAEGRKLCAAKPRSKDCEGPGGQGKPAWEKKGMDYDFNRENQKKPCGYRSLQARLNSTKQGVGVQPRRSEQGQSEREAKAKKGGYML